MGNGDDNTALIAHSEFMAFVGDDATHRAVLDFAETMGFPAAVVQPGDVNSLTELVAQASVLPKIILIDIDGVSDATPKLVRLIEALEGTSKIIAVGSTNDVKLFRGLLSAGAADYIIKPLSPEIVGSAFDNAEKQIAANRPAGQAADAAKAVTFIGVRGGVGTSTIAVNVAWLLAHRLGFNTALFDLDLQYGTAALALDLVPGRGLREVLETPGRLDSLLIASSLVVESDKLSLLSGEEALEENINLHGDAVGAVLADMRKNFAYILVDLPRHRLASQKKLLAESDTIVLVAEQTLAAIRDVVRMKAALKGIAPNARLLCVVSRTSPARSGDRAAQVDLPTFERGIQDKVMMLVPEDPMPVAQAANRGMALAKLAPNALVTRALQTIAETLAGRKAPIMKQALWSRLAQRFKPKGKKGKIPK